MLKREKLDNKSQDDIAVDGISLELDTQHTLLTAKTVVYDSLHSSQDEQQSTLIFSFSAADSQKTVAVDPFDSQETLVPDNSDSQETLVFENNDSQRTLKPSF